MRNKRNSILIGVAILLLTACGAENDADNPGATTSAYEQNEETRADTEISPEDVVERSWVGHWEYTGYLDECIQWTEYEEFVGCDYDGDGLKDRVYREYHAKPNTGEWCDYQVEFGNGEVILAQNCADTGFPQIQHGDLDGDGRQEILFTLSYPTSTYPPAFGNVMLYEWTREGYREAELPFSAHSYENHTYCLNVQYDPRPNFTFHTTVLENDFQMDVELDEDAWVMAGDREKRTDEEVLWEVTLIQEEEGAYLKCNFDLLGKWCVDEIIAIVVKDDNAYRIDRMSSVNHYREKFPISLDEGKEYYLLLNGWKDSSEESCHIQDIEVNYVENNTGYFPQIIHLSDAIAEVEGEKADDLESMDRTGSLFVEDINGDGYEDFGILRKVSGKTKSYYLYQWNPTEEKFSFEGAYER
ncbi:MAG: hypothetical protein J1E64_11740 [Acetatifactor sp.]|nr:hypothetical protein [Acetatifactor sp.]